MSGHGNQDADYLNGRHMERECCNPECGWQGKTGRMCGSVGPLCPDCGEVTEPTPGVSRIEGESPAPQDADGAPK